MRHPDSSVTDIALNAVRRRDTAVMLFGSAARDEATAASDIDILELTTRRARPYRTGNVHVSVYDLATLENMAERGSLFVLHLQREGLVIRDPHGELTRTLEAYRAPTSYEPYREILRELSGLLDVSRNEYLRRWLPLHDAIVFIVRSALYAEFADRGDPVFSMTVIRQRIRSPSLDATLSLKRAPGPDCGAFDNAKSYVEALLATNVHNPYGSIEAFITNLFDSNPLAAPFGLRLLGASDFELTYDLFTFPG